MPGAEPGTEDIGYIFIYWLNSDILLLHGNSSKGQRPSSDPERGGMSVQLPVIERARERRRRKSRGRRRERRRKRGGEGGEGREVIRKWKMCMRV